MKEYKIGLVIADEMEYAPLLEKKQELGIVALKTAGRPAHQFTVKNGQNVARIHSVCSGIGKVNAAVAATALAENGCEILLNCGLSGGVSAVSRGGLNAPEIFLEHDFNMTGLGYKRSEKPNQDSVFFADKDLLKIFDELLPGIVHGTAVTGDHFVCNAKVRETIKRDFDAVSCDMESAAIAYVCNTYNIKFGCLRKISDDAGAENSNTCEAYRSMNNLAESTLVDILLEVIKAIIK